MGTILISGASTGIGRATALRLDNAGHTVLAGVRNQEAANSLREASNGRVEPVFLDIAHPESIEKAVSDLSEKLAGGLHGLFNNAGIAVPGALEYLPMEEWRRQFEVNVFGHIDLTRQVLRHVRRVKGRIVFTSSIGGKVATAFIGPYNASKFAIEGLGDSLRQELAPFGVEVSIIEPGAVATPMIDGVDQVGPRALAFIGDDGGDTYRQLGGQVMKAFNTFRKSAINPDEVAKAVEHALFASRPKTRYLVGKDAKIQATLNWLLTDRAFDRLKQKLMPG